MYDRMLDKQNRPAFDDMAAYCGKSMKLFIRINEWLSEVCETTQEIVWLHYRVTGEAHFCDIQKMLEVKCAL